nr:uncharacterized protein LOC122273666 [Parasteatoda tepidariorum]
MYDSLKQRSIEIFSISEERRLKKLLQEIALGDRRPSALLRQMQDLAGDRDGDALLKSLWLQRLPTQMQAILSTSSDTLNKLSYNGKLDGHALLAANVNGHANCRLVVIDRTLGLKLLVDTGADISVLPPSRNERNKTPSILKLFAANGSQIPVKWN